MSQKYVVVSRKNPVNPDADPKYYALAKSTAKISIKEICVRISERSSYSRGELEGCINEFLIETQHVLEEGNIAQMGDLGNFRLSVRTKVPSMAADLFNKSNIGIAKVLFWPGASLRKLCRTMDYELYKADERKKTA